MKALLIGDVGAGLAPPNHRPRTYAIAFSGLVLIIIALYPTKVHADVILPAVTAAPMFFPLYAMVFAVIESVPKKRPHRPFSAGVANMETTRSTLSQYSADSDDGCYPETAAIGDDYDQLLQTLRDYDLFFPEKISAVEWSSIDYVRDDCESYRLTVALADKDKTRFITTPMGVCCDDAAPTAPNCSARAKNVSRCSQLLK
jgi:hypothetical protein